MNTRHIRPTRRRGAGLVLVTCLGLLALAPAASAAATDKVTICHATGSTTNPYVHITISENALKAHRAHQGREDIIPAPALGCPDVPVLPPPPIDDLCPNIAGDQATVPVGFVVDPAGDCVPVVTDPPPVVILCVVSAGVQQSDTTVTGTLGDDTIDCSAASPGKTIDGFAGNDTITGTQFGDLITGGEGNDTITGLGGIDALSGDLGNDTISGGEDDDIITGSEGNDTLSGEGGNDFVSGGDNDDVLSGGAGINTLIGGLGTDTCDGGPCSI